MRSGRVSGVEFLKVTAVVTLNVLKEGIDGAMYLEAWIV